MRTCWLVIAVLLPACSAAADRGAVAPVTTATTAATATTPTPSPSGIALPNPGMTPGATDPRVTQADISQTICVPGYTATVRPPEAVTEALKVRVIAAYRLGGALSSYEVDHLIPLELGGAPAG